MAYREPKDIRSTGRRHARKALFKAQIIFECANCKAVPETLPKDWPIKNPPPIGLGEKRCTRLEAQHLTKNLSSNDVADLKWLCPQCHKLEDLLTEKGQTLKGDDEYGYGSLL